MKNKYDRVVTVMLPTRNRMTVEGGLLDTLESLYKNTEHKDKIEVILRIDDDDYNTLDNLKLIDKYYEELNISIIQGDRYGGYKDIWKYWNEMASMAKGEFLFAFNDDATIDTFGWETILEKHSGKIGLIKAKFNGNENGTTQLLFPIIHSKIVEIQGYLGFHETMDGHYDMFIDIGKDLGHNFEILENDIITTHIPLGGEHVKDGLVSDVGGVYRYGDKITEDVKKVINNLKEK